METRPAPRVITCPGPRVGQLSDRPTCGVCHHYIADGETYAAVLYEGDWDKGDRLREVRCLTPCADYATGKGRDLRPGDVVWTQRYLLTDWGPMIKAQVVHLTDDFNERGWRGVWMMPADPTDQSPIDSLREGDEDWAVRLADEIGTVDPLPRRVFMADEELVHYFR